MAGTERAVEIASGLASTLVLPRADGPHPCVVLLHGFGGHRDETGDLFAKLAKIEPHADGAELTSGEEI